MMMERREKGNECSRRESHLTIVDFSRMCPLALCTLDLGLPMDDDLVMAGPFEDSDEYFLRRQREAFGKETEAIARISRLSVRIRDPV